MKRKFLDLVLVISITGFIFFTGIYIYDQVSFKKSTVEAEQVQEQIGILMDTPVKKLRAMNEVVHILPKYQSLYEINNDLVGFIYIDDQHRFPILQKLNNQSYYLTHDFFGNESSFGSIFANSSSRLGEPGITLIYGHHIKNNQMFSCLDSYKNKDFFENAEPIQVDTLYEESLYDVAAVAICNMNDNFKYYEYVGDLTESRFELWKVLMEDKVLWGNLEGLSYQDEIIELSTCSYEKKGNRLIIVLAKK